eukprot:CAMPEP_0174969434 /NCGR_PEP_ID=MMETSP0004_2-20121128/8758_1 /TAXON_ID=420556 /ORGANISM="Ochromonas sp., Strain CCMP1393" /LENGTH=152 /DNA_ID=CAMNT_0016218919 /DNA_START=253 /DNA_END=708 /DNA_ORIENTATION=-
MPKSDENTLLEYDGFQGLLEKVSLYSGIIFFVYLARLMIHKKRMFMKQQGRRHALLGLAYFLWISTGFLNLLRHEEMVNFLLFDVVLGILGILLPLSAAEDFSHKRIKNIASGTLDAHATVTHSEMIEHSFYQAINLVQVLFFHFAPLYSNW